MMTFGQGHDYVTQHGAVISTFLSPETETVVMGNINIYGDCWTVFIWRVRTLPPALTQIFTQPLLTSGVRGLKTPIVPRFGNWVAWEVWI